MTAVTGSASAGAVGSSVTSLTGPRLSTSAFPLPIPHCTRCRRGGKRRGDPHACRYFADIVRSRTSCNGHVQPGDTRRRRSVPAPFGLSAILGARLYSPSHGSSPWTSPIPGWRPAKLFGADLTVNNGREDPVRVREGADGRPGCRCRNRSGGRAQRALSSALSSFDREATVANVGVHGAPAALHLETLWIRDVTVTTGLVDTYYADSASPGRLASDRGRSICHPVVLISTT